MAFDNELLSYLQEIDQNGKGIIINPQDLIFEETVKMNCFYCGKYGNNWRCPPNLPNIDFQKMVMEFDKGLFVIESYEITDKMVYGTVRTESSVHLHKVLLQLEKFMWNHNRSTAISFIGGSCKLCRGGCGKDKCNNPYMSRSPLEAIGVNIVKSFKKYGIDISFPSDEQMIRCGLLLWQEEV